MADGPQTLSTGSTVVAEPPAARSEASEESAENWLEQPATEGGVSIDDALRAKFGFSVSASKPGDQDQGDEDDSAPAEEPGSPGPLKPADAPTPPAAGAGATRRTRAEAARAELDAVKAENERLKADAERIKAEAVEQAKRELQMQDAQAKFDEDFLGNQQRFEALSKKPFSSLSAEESDWLETRKERRAWVDENLPHVEGHYAQQAHEYVESTRRAFLDTVRRDLTDAASLPHVDAERLKSLTSWAEIARHLHAAGAAWKEAEQVDLRKQLEDLRRQLPGSARASLPSGRSSGAANGQTMDQRMRASLGF